MDQLRWLIDGTPVRAQMGCVPTPVVRGVGGAWPAGRTASAQLGAGA